MKKICVQISDASSVAASIEKIDKQIPDSTKHLPGFDFLYNQVITCIEDFGTTAKKISKKGTALHLEKEVIFSNFSVLITLDYPNKVSFFDRVKNIFSR